MADNTTLDGGSGGDVIATDDIGGVKHQRVKIEYGDADSATEVSDTNPLPVDDAGGSLTVDGTELTAIQAAVETLDNTVAGTELQVDLVDPGAIGGTDGGAHGASQQGVRALGTDGTNDQQIAVDATGNVQVDIVADGAGLALAANQLADGHNVTVDNGAAGAAVNIQDGGNTITVDGTVTADAGTGPWPVTDNAGSLTVDTVADATDGGAHGASQTGFRAMGTDGTNDQQISVDATGNVQVDIVADAAGLATAANQLANGHDVTIDNASGGAAVNIQDGGNDISVDWAGTAPPIGAGTEAAALRVTLATDSTGQVTVDASQLDVDDLDRTTDNVGAVDTTGAIMSDTTVVTPAFAVIDAATSGNNTLVAAGTNKIRVLSCFLVSAGTVNVRFESGADGTALTGQMNLVANTGFVLPYNPLGWFETASATLLNLELSGAVSVDGSLTYIDVA